MQFIYIMCFWAFSRSAIPIPNLDVLWLSRTKMHELCEVRKDPEHNLLD